MATEVNKPKSSIDAFGRTEAFNHLQQLLWNFNNMRRIEGNEAMVPFLNDSISRIKYLITEEQKRIEIATGCKPKVYNN